MTPPLSAHVSMLFTELPPIDRPRAAADAGFSHVESWWPPAPDTDAWAAAVIGAGVAVSCLNADGGDIARGERGFCNLAEREDDVVRACLDTLGVASQVAAPCINVLPGLRVGDRPVAAQLDQAARVYRQLGDLAERHDAVVVIEPINAVDVPQYLVPRADDVAALLGLIDHPAVRMLFDVYHCAMSGDDPVAMVHRHAALIGHVQYADCPGRGAPGTGQVDLSAVLSALDDIGYDGAVGLEFDPKGPTSEALRSLPPPIGDRSH